MKSGLISSHVISVSIPLEAANSGPPHIPIVERSLLLRCCGNLAFLFIQSQDKSSHLKIIWCTLNFPKLLYWTSCSSRLGTFFSRKSLEVKKAIFFHQRNQGSICVSCETRNCSACTAGVLASSRGKGDVSWFFSICGGNLAYNINLQWEWPFKTRVCSASSGLLSSCEGTLGFSSWLGRAIGTSLEPRQHNQGPLLVATVILGFLSIFKWS